MSSVSESTGKKWIQTSVAITCMLLGYVLIGFFSTLGEWFELESKFKFYYSVSQFISVVVSFVVFLYVLKNEKISTFLNEVYYEVMKVVWPNKNETVRHTIGIMIGVSIIGLILGLFDVIAAYFITLIA